MTRKALAVIGLAVGVALSGATPAHADGWLDKCNIWHGEQYCREQYAKAHIPSQGQMHERGRDCHTSWADRRRGCDSQARSKGFGFVDVGEVAGLAVPQAERRLVRGQAHDGGDL